MRRRGGCLGLLTILALGAVVLSALLPLAAAGLVTVGLEAAGLRGDRLAVRVEAEPALRLLTGDADRVVVDGSGVRWGTTTAASLRLVLVGVDLLGRRAATIEGRLTGVETGGPTGPLAVASVEIDGPGTGPDARLAIAPGEAGRVVADLAASVGLVGGRVVLEPPDRVAVAVAGRRLEARIGVDEGSVVVAGSGLPRLVLLEAGVVAGLAVGSVRVQADGGLVVEGRLDPTALGLVP